MLRIRIVGGIRTRLGSNTFVYSGIKKVFVYVFVFSCQVVVFVFVFSDFKRSSICICI